MAPSRKNKHNLSVKVPRQEKKKNPLRIRKKAEESECGAPFQVVSLFSRMSVSMGKPYLQGERVRFKKEIWCRGLV